MGALAKALERMKKLFEPSIDKKLEEKVEAKNEESEEEKQRRIDKAEMQKIMMGKY